MKTITRDKVEGKIHHVKNTIKRAPGIITGNNELENEGIDKYFEGKIQEKVGQKKVMDE